MRQHQQGYDVMLATTTKHRAGLFGDFMKL